jgi:hypothetical protein
MRQIFPALVIFAGCATFLQAQNVQTMRASIRGGGGGDQGKCTIEVEVDHVADVEIRGDMGYIRTLQGQPATWRRFECNAPMPRNPVDFRFKGVDGRGNVNLVRDPRNGGVAVVRVEDRDGGREGYTFDLEWSGGSGYYSGNDPYRNDPYRNDPYRNDPNYRNNRNDRYSRNDPYYNNNDRYTRNRSIYGEGVTTAAAGMCEDAVRTRARQEYGVRNPLFIGADVNDRPGNRDQVYGAFEDNRGVRYDYTCTVNTRNGRINQVDVRRR